MTSNEIVKSLNKCAKLLRAVIVNFDGLESSDPKTKRLAKNGVVFGLFELIDELHKTEIDIYNLLHKGEDK
jgi:hypothetical protein